MAMAAAATVVLGRRLLTAPRTQRLALDATDGAADADAMLLRIQRDDRFFCETMELIPAQFYFPTDEEENWLKSAPKKGGKYHRDVLAMKQQQSSKKAIKRAKFNPSEQKTNEERQLEAAEEERQQKLADEDDDASDRDHEDDDASDDEQPKKKKAKKARKQPTSATPINVQPAKDPSNVSIDGLKERLAAKLQAMREQRKADEKSGKKRKTNANAKAAAEPASKKRKSNATTASNGSAFNNKGKKAANGHADASASTAANGSSTNGESLEVTGSSISYGSLLLADEKKEEKKKTRNGQGLRGIKNLLKKAERNQQRMEELKKTEEGKALVQAKGWDKALKQAAGEVVMDDPKLLRKKLKKKEKAKVKSSKEWKKRTAQVEIQKKEKQKKRLENLRTGGKKDKKDGSAPSSTRAGFEGKKGEGFLNAEKKKPHASPGAGGGGPKKPTAGKKD